ncbi:MAG TPA: sigma-54 dependent transcriptional regulator, partial [Bacteroidota bacterium]
MFEGSVIQILLIEDEDFDVRRIRNTLRPFADRICIPDVVSNGNAALDLLRAGKDRYDIVVMDFQIAGGIMGEQLIQEIKRIDPSVQIIVVTKMTVNITDYDFANRLLVAGAFWYCTKYPGDIEDSIYQPTDFILSIFNAYQKRLLEREQSRAKRKFAHTIEGILAGKQLLGDSALMEDLRLQIRKCAESNAHVLVSGASGTGKELVAHNIHYTSSRRFENFVPVNCGSLPQELIESELFGYEKGAFTGATQRKLGLFEVANHGTLFLDEIGEMPPQAQVKLLRVIQDGEIEKIGRTDKIRVDVRIIAATNKDLEREVREQRFREDLFYRLNVLPVRVPSLKERREDIPRFIEHFLSLFAAEMHRPAPSLEPDAVRALLQYDWPGNIRELKNVLQRLVFENESVITKTQTETALGRRLRTPGPGEGFQVTLPPDGSLLAWRQMERMVREKYFRYVRQTSGSDADAAKKLGLAPPNYHRMCKELGL